MTPLVARNALALTLAQCRGAGYAQIAVRGFSGRRARRATRTQMTPQENLLLQQKLKEMQMMQMQQQPRKQGLLDIVKEGALHGIGWAFAQRIVDSIFGPRTLNISDFTNHTTDGDSGLSSFSNDASSNSPFAEDSGQDQGWSWGSDLFSDDE